MSKKRTSSSKRWLAEHESDPYVKQARRDGYRSRSAYKLEELDKRDRLVRQGITIVDLGAAPGGWCQYLQRRYGTSVRIFALDILPMGALPGVHIIEGDFRQDTVLAALEAALGTGPVHLVLSDMAPNISGVNAADQAGSMHLADLALEFARGRLAPNGVLLLKMFQGEGFDEFLRNLRQLFDKVVIRKPQASRSRSSEVYLVARNSRVR